METLIPTDHELVQEFVNGSRTAIETLIKRHQKRVYGYILLLVKNQHLAEDIFQDTFVKVIKSLQEGRYNDNGRFVSWVMRIAHNLIIDHFRRERQNCIISNDALEYDLFNTSKFSPKNIEDDIVHEQIIDSVRELVQQLPPEQREVVLLRHYADLSFKEIAEQTNVSINTALGRMRYALMNIRKQMEKNNITLTAI